MMIETQQSEANGSNGTDGAMLRFPTASGDGERDFTADGRTRGIELLLKSGRTPEDFAIQREWFEVRKEAGPGVEWPGIDISDDDLCGFDLSDANLIGAALPPVNGSILRHARLERAVIRVAQGAIFDHADMSEATLCSASLEGSSFAGANLGGADLEEASLRLAKFDGANLTETSFIGADLTGSTIHLALCATGADFTDAEGLTDQQRHALAALGAIGLGPVHIAPLLDIVFSA
ncbi:MAG: pentapeptide repeat-containing protein [Thermomicrobiales bacterium]